MHPNWIKYIFSTQEHTYTCPGHRFTPQCVNLKTNNFPFNFLFFFVLVMWWNVTWTCLHEIHPHVVQCVNTKWLSLYSFPSSPCNKDWRQTLVLACNHLTSARTKLSQHRESFTHRQELMWIMVHCALWAIKEGGIRSGRSATQVHTYICSALHSKLQKQLKLNEKQTGAIDWRTG